MTKTEKTNFWQDYWIITFEGIVVALFIATLALIGVFLKLTIPFALQLVVVAILVFYKRLKRKTEIAIETNVEAKIDDATESIAALYDNEKKKYYKTNKIDTKIRRYQWFAIIPLFVSIVLVAYLPYLEEEEKRHLEKTREEAVEKREAEIIEKLEALKPSVENLTQKLEVITTKIEAREAEIRLFHEGDKNDAPPRTRGK